LQIGFVLAFAVIGALVSTLSGFLVGNRFTYILFVSGISTIAFGGLGFGIYTVLETKVPEFLEFITGFSLGGFGTRDREGDFDDTSMDSGAAGDVGMASQEEMASSLSPHEQAMEASMARARSGKFGDHIIVDKIAIKNEPKLMAEAIRTMLAKDDPQE